MKGRIIEQRSLGWHFEENGTIDQGKEYHFGQVFPLDTIVKMLMKVGFDKPDVDEITINGWGCDFSWPLKHSIHGDFIFSGSLFFGKYKITKQ